MRRALALLLTVAAPACGQSFADGVKILCDAPNDPALAGIADPAERTHRMAVAIDARLKNAEARQLFEAMAPMDPRDKQMVLAEAARHAGLRECAMSEHLAR